MAAMAGEGVSRHGGRLLARRLKAHGVRHLFTLSGGHLFAIYDGCREEGITIVDVRHEATAAFAAEGWAKVTRTPGVAALTAGPGVTNGMSALASAQQNNSPILVLGGRAPKMRWGRGSLQEIDHIPFVSPLVKMAATAQETAQIPGLVEQALDVAMTHPFGPTFLDFPVDVTFMESGEAEIAVGQADLAAVADDGALLHAARLLRDAERPVVMAGTNLYWGRGEDALLGLVEARGVPVFLNGLARGCIPADHHLFFSRARSAALRDADLVLLIGLPMDFRLGFGDAIAAAAQIIVADVAPPSREYPRPVAEELYGALPATLDALRPRGPRGGDTDSTDAWVAHLREIEREKRKIERVQLDDDRAPLHPLRVYSELGGLLDRDAVIVVDGGDFASYAGRVIDSFAPGCWLDPGPFGCLGSGPGYALAAKIAHPNRQVVLLVGDGAFGFSGMEFDTLSRHGVNVVGVMGNNGMWGLEHHPMMSLFGYSVAATLRPHTRYDLVVEALGGHGELVETPTELRPALERALGAGRPALVNVLTDPSVSYPRSTNLA